MVNKCLVTVTGQLKTQMCIKYSLSEQLACLNNCASVLCRTIIGKMSSQMWNNLLVLTLNRQKQGRQTQMFEQIYLLNICVIRKMNF